MLNEESEPLGLWVSWVKTKTQAFYDILDAAILSVPVCGEDGEVVERFTFDVYKVKRLSLNILSYKVIYD